MVETVWVLDRVYELTAQAVADAVEKLLQTDTLVIQNEQEVFAATIALRAGVGSFSDALIGALGERAGCTVILTFDRKATRLTGFQLA